MRMLEKEITRDDLELFGTEKQLHSADYINRQMGQQLSHYKGAQKYANKQVQMHKNQQQGLVHELERAQAAARRYNTYPKSQQPGTTAKSGATTTANCITV